MGTLLLLFYFMVLKLVTFNARGLMNGFKFEKVKDLCRNEDVILLQETNWKENVMEDFFLKMVKNYFSIMERKKMGGFKKGKARRKERDMTWPTMVSHTWNLCSAFNPSKCTHTQQ